MFTVRMAFRLQRRMPQASVQHLRVPPRQRRPKDRDRPERPLRRLQDVLQPRRPLHGLYERPPVPQDVPRLRHPLGQNQLSPYLIISPCVKSSEPLTSSPTASCEQDWGNLHTNGEERLFHLRGGQTPDIQSITSSYSPKSKGSNSQQVGGQRVMHQHLTFSPLQIPALPN